MRPFLRAGSGIELKVLNWHLLGAVRLSAHTAEAGIREGKGEVRIPTRYGPFLHFSECVSCFSLLN